MLLLEFWSVPINGDGEGGEGFATRSWALRALAWSDTRIPVPYPVWLADWTAVFRSELGPLLTTRTCGISSGESARRARETESRSQIES
ncbi:hypothetical protein MRX96_014086 [Rhipicephalus microplus]